MFGRRRALLKKHPRRSVVAAFLPRTPRIWRRSIDGVYGKTRTAPSVTNANDGPGYFLWRSSARARAAIMIKHIM